MEVVGTGGVLIAVMLILLQGSVEEQEKVVPSHGSSSIPGCRLVISH